MKLDLAPVPGAEIARLIGALAATPKELLDAAAEATRNTEKTRIGKASIPVETMTGVIADIRRRGRNITFERGGEKRKVRVSGRHTRISIAGAKAARGALEAGMACVLTYRGTTAKKIACK